MTRAEAIALGEAKYQDACDPPDEHNYGARKVAFGAVWDAVQERIAELERELEAWRKPIAAYVQDVAQARLDAQGGSDGK